MVLPIPSLFETTPSNFTFNQLFWFSVLFDHKKFGSESFPTIMSGLPSFSISPIALE